MAVTETTEAETTVTDAVLAKVIFPADVVVLEETLGRLDDATFELKPSLAVEGPGLTAQLQVHTPDVLALEAAFDEDPTVARYERQVSSDETHLYRVQWAREPPAIELLLGNGGSPVRASTEGGKWHITVLFSDREMLSRAADSCDRIDVRIMLDKLTPAEISTENPCRMTDVQIETVKRALELGYYEIPRGVTLVEIAEEMDVSHQSLSERLRRAHGRIVAQLLESKSVEIDHEEGERP
jgi:predicted DNA binding protein